MKALTTAASTIRHAAGVALEAILLVAIVVAVAFGAAVALGNGPGGADSVLAAKGGNGHGGGGNQAPTASGCTVDGTTVNGFGLPTDEVLNFFVTDAAGTRGWVLGFSGDGTWSEAVDARAGSTLYEFASRTWGPNGSRYTVFASCSAS